jgi:5-hydroxyisourate hydrolase-like protein (transthyretin family)
MKALTRVVASAALLLCATSAALSESPSQSQKESPKPTGSISGRVTITGKPARGVAMTLVASFSGPRQQMAPNATTDEDGRYKMAGVAAGRYTVVPHAYAYVGPNAGEYGQRGKMITLTEGEAVDGLDFALTRGGVITGRVTDSDGRPLIEQHVHLYMLDERTQRINRYSSPSLSETDDRGVYRIYGLPPGRYLVAVGDTRDGDRSRMGYGGRYYPGTYHPDAAEPSKAVSIDLQAGAEATGIDIRVGRATKTFVAAGRIIDAETGKPVASMMYGVGRPNKDSTSLLEFNYTSERTDSTGRFRLEGLNPGRYNAFAVPDRDSGFYSEPTLFEVTDGDVSGLQLKVHRGAAITGRAVIEGTTDPEVLAKLAGLELSAYVMTPGLQSPNPPIAIIAPDGSFRVSGLRPGRTMLMLDNYPAPVGLSIARIERDGAQQADGVEVGAGEQVTGVKVVLAYGTCVIRGQVRIEGGELPQGTRLGILVHRIGGKPDPHAWIEADARGHFLVEGLSEGDYTVALQVSVPFGMKYPQGLNLPRQAVSVTQACESEVVLVLDLAKGRKDGEEGQR